MHKLASRHSERVHECVRGEREGGRWRERHRESGVCVSGSVCLCVNALTERCKERGRGGERKGGQGGRRPGVSEEQDQRKKLLIVSCG